MSNYDFSTSERYLYRVAIREGNPISDSMFYSAIDAMGADQIGLQLKSDLLLEIDETQNRKRGRPTANILKRQQLAVEVEQLSDDIMAEDLRTALIDRLRTGRRHKSLTTEINYHRAWQKHLKRMDIRILYRRALEQLQAGPPYNDEIFKFVDVEKLDARSNGAKAVLIAADILKRIKARPPSPRRMLNIVSENSFEKRERD